MLRVAICGLGRIGSLHYKNIKNFNKYYKISYLFDSNLALAEKYEEDIYLPKRFSDIVSLKPIDAVFICSPTETHYDIIMESLAKGLHVFVEKPISLKSKEIEKCFDEAKLRKLKLFVGFNRRFAPAINIIKKRYSNGLIQDPQQVLVISRDYPYPDKRFIETSGGIFHDCVIHDIDSICWILGEYPKRVYASGSITTDIGRETGHLDNATTILEFPSGITANLLSSRIGNSYDQRIEFMGASKSLKINNKATGIPISFPDRYWTAYLNEVSDFYNLVKGKKVKTNNPTKEECLNIDKITNLVEESYRQGRALDYK